jgi:hypothetical protein
VIAASFIVPTLPVAGQAPPTAFATGTKADEAAIRSVIDAEEDTGESPHIAPNLDWENAFGIRYTDLKKRNDFFNAVVKPLQAKADSGILEVKISFLKPDLAVADEYWHIVGQIDQATNKPGADRWGRTTFVFEKLGGDWTMVLSRVADLRAPYYKHFDAIPPAVSVASATLASYAGTYERVAGKPSAVVSVTGDHLLVVLRGQTYTAIPMSSTEFLVFDPNDLAEYTKLIFKPGTAGKVSLVLERASGETLEEATKAP